MKYASDAIGDRKFRSLRWLNAARCSTHIAQAGVILALSNDFTVTLTNTFLNWLPGAAAPETATEGIHDIRAGRDRLQQTNGVHGHEYARRIPPLLLWHD